MSTAEMTPTKEKKIKPLLRLNITISPELFELIERMRGETERTVFIEEKLRENPDILRGSRRHRIPLLPRRKAGRFPEF